MRFGLSQLIVEVKHGRLARSRFLEKSWSPNCKRNTIVSGSQKRQAWKKILKMDSEDAGKHAKFSLGLNITDLRPGTTNQYESVISEDEKSEQFSELYFDAVLYHFLILFGKTGPMKSRYVVL